MTPDPRAPLGVGDHYRTARGRIDELIRSVDATAWDTPVPTCPGWRVRDVLGHLVGIIEDADAGRLSGPPTTEQTEEEVDRHRDDDPIDLLATWSEIAPGFEAGISATARWPAVLDVVSHEHDIRGAVHREAADSDDVELTGTLLAEWIRAPLEIDLGHRVVRSGTGAAELRLRTTAFEVLRFRMGRRTRDQVRAYDWSADPEPVLDDLFVFGPAVSPISY